MEDSQTGYAVGSNSTLLRTTNSGINWVLLPCGSIGNFMSVHFINFQTGWISGYDGTVIKTTNSGVNWISELEWCALPFKFYLLC